MRTPTFGKGTLALMVLKTLQTMGPLHRWGIARRIEQVGEGLVSVKYGTWPRRRECFVIHAAKSSML
jgi:hypothetical protein